MECEEEIQAKAKVTKVDHGSAGTTGRSSELYYKWVVGHWDSGGSGVQGPTQSSSQEQAGPYTTGTSLMVSLWDHHLTDGMVWRVQVVGSRRRLWSPMASAAAYRGRVCGDLVWSSLSASDRDLGARVLANRAFTTGSTLWHWDKWLLGVFAARRVLLFGLIRPCFSSFRFWGVFELFGFSGMVSCSHRGMWVVSRFSLPFSPRLSLR